MRLDELFITIDLPSDVEVQEHAAKHSHSNAPQRKWPRWALVCVALGGLLSVGAGAFLIALGAMQ